jgi:hypothetical protein
LAADPSLRRTILGEEKWELKRKGRIGHKRKKCAGLTARATL